MAVGAFDEVDVVGALAILEGGVHGFYRNAAIGQLGMAGAARRAGLLAVLEVTGHAAQSFMDADGRAVVTTAHLQRGSGRVALVAQRLALVGADVHLARAIEHFRGQRQLRDGNVLEFAAIEQRDRRTIDFLLPTGHGLLRDGLGHGRAHVMNLMAGEAGNGGFVFQFGAI